MKTPTAPALGRQGEPATATEIALTATPLPERIESPSDQLRAISHSIAATLQSSGLPARQAQFAAATALVAILDELGTSRTRLPSRRGFFMQLLRPQLPAMCRTMRANRWRNGDIARLIGVSRRTVERALAAECDKRGAALSQPERGDSRG